MQDIIFLPSSNFLLFLDNFFLSPFFLLFFFPQASFVQKTPQV